MKKYTRRSTKSNLKKKIIFCGKTKRKHFESYKTLENVKAVRATGKEDVLIFVLKPRNG